MSAGSADVWFARIGEHARDIDRFSRDLLSREERGRLTEYRLREAAERYVVTRSLVRAVLSEHLGVHAQDIAVSRTDMGKPIVSHGTQFNVSHSGDLVVLAVCHDRPVGIDIERRREVARVDALVKRWLTERERQEIAVLVGRGASMSDAFLRIWSAKEARLKALGVGIAGAATAPVDSVDARTIDDLLATIPVPVSDQEGGYVGALAIV